MSEIENQVEEVVVDSYDFDGFQVVRREFFSHKYQPAITINHDNISFNMSSIRKLCATDHIQLLINPVEKKLIIRNCTEEAKDAVKWCNTRIKDEKTRVTNRKIKCNIFTGKVFDLMKWNPNYRYKIQGTVVRTPNEVFMVFNLDETEIFTPIVKDDEVTSKMGSKPYYPEGWRDSFGLPVEAHEKALNINLLDGFARLDIVQKQRTSKRKKTEAPVNTDNDQLTLFNVDGTPYDPNEVGGPVHEDK